MFFGKFLPNILLSLLVLNSFNVPSVLATEVDVSWAKVFYTEVNKPSNLAEVFDTEVKPSNFNTGVFTVSGSKAFRTAFNLWSKQRSTSWAKTITDQLKNNIGVSLNEGMFSDIIEFIYGTKVKGLSSSKSVMGILHKYTGLNWRLSYADDRYSFPYSVYEYDCKYTVKNKPGKLVFTIMYSKTTLMFFNLQFQPDEPDEGDDKLTMNIKNITGNVTWDLNLSKCNGLNRNGVELDKNLVKNMLKSIYYQLAYTTIVNAPKCDFDFDPVINVLNRLTGYSWNVDTFQKVGQSYNCCYYCLPNPSVKCIFKISYSDKGIVGWDLKLDPLNE